MSGSLLGIEIGQLTVVVPVMPLLIKISRTCLYTHLRLATWVTTTS